ncbi:phage tail protein I [Microvirga sp. 17 mud 1-3]|uniref:phage tail protein I n=1 Tax=Microvirga sp. 17 mud 1-3 TaxID=2082949 RepID=UPI0013A58ADB|nr:phage tail protein I [Microvirga sp. 17 mud 1-3]
MNSATLLPPSATDQERALELATARLGDVPVLVREAWNPDTCPAELLPWLAWAFSVDEWQESWSEAEKRGVIKSALYVHKKKGTLAALKRAVAPLGYIIRIIEWFEETPHGAPYTFRLEVGVLDKGVNETIYQQMERIIRTYKNVRSQMLSLTIKGEVSGKAYFAAGMMSGVETTVYPYVAEDIESIAGMYWAAGEQSADTVAVYPV